MVNTRSSVDPFLTSSSRRDLRERVWKAFKNRGDNGGANDTNATIARIVKLRAERARLLGFRRTRTGAWPTRWPATPKRAQDLMMRVWPAAVARSAKKSRTCRRSPSASKAKITIEPWDYLYYAEKVRKAKYDLDQNELKPYFELNNMIEASFWWPAELYGLTFTEITGKVPVFHPDVRVWEVKERRRRAVGLFYGDYFAREGKRSGAWGTATAAMRRSGRRSRPSCRTTTTSSGARRASRC